MLIGTYYSFLLTARLKKNPDKEISDYIDSAGILFIAIIGFGDTDTRSISILNEIIAKFDQMLALYNVEKIKLIGKFIIFQA